MHICMDRRKPLLNLKAWQIVSQYKVIIHFFQQGLPDSINKLTYKNERGWRNMIDRQMIDRQSPW